MNGHVLLMERSRYVGLTGKRERELGGGGGGEKEEREGGKNE